MNSEIADQAKVRSRGDETAAAVATKSARQTLARRNPAAMSREEIVADLAKYPPVVPIEAGRP